MERNSPTIKTANPFADLTIQKSPNPLIRLNTGMKIMTETMTQKSDLENSPKIKQLQDVAKDFDAKYKVLTVQERKEKLLKSAEKAKRKSTPSVIRNCDLKCVTDSLVEKLIQRKISDPSQPTVTDIETANTSLTTSTGSADDKNTDNLASNDSKGLIQMPEISREHLIADATQKILERARKQELHRGNRLDLNADYVLNKVKNLVCGDNVKIPQNFTSSTSQINKAETVNNSQPEENMDADVGIQKNPGEMAIQQGEELAERQKDCIRMLNEARRDLLKNIMQNGDSHHVDEAIIESETTELNPNSDRTEMEKSLSLRDRIRIAFSEGFFLENTYTSRGETMIRKIEDLDRRREEMVAEAKRKNIISETEGFEMEDCWINKGQKQNFDEFINHLLYRKIKQYHLLRSYTGRELTTDDLLDFVEYPPETLTNLQNYFKKIQIENRNYLLQRIKEKVSKGYFFNYPLSEKNKKAGTPEYKILLNLINEAKKKQHHYETSSSEDDEEYEEMTPKKYENVSVASLQRQTDTDDYSPHPVDGKIEISLGDNSKISVDIKESYYDSPQLVIDLDASVREEEKKEKQSIDDDNLSKIRQKRNEKYAHKEAQKQPEIESDESETESAEEDEESINLNNLRFMRNSEYMFSEEQLKLLSKCMHDIELFEWAAKALLNAKQVDVIPNTQFLIPTPPEITPVLPEELRPLLGLRSPKSIKIEYVSPKEENTEGTPTGKIGKLKVKRGRTRPFNLLEENGIAFNPNPVVMSAETQNRVIGEILKQKPSVTLTSKDNDAFTQLLDWHTNKRADLEDLNKPEYNEIIPDACHYEEIPDLSVEPTDTEILPNKRRAIVYPPEPVEPDFHHHHHGPETPEETPAEEHEDENDQPPALEEDSSVDSSTTPAPPPAGEPEPEQPNPQPEENSITNGVLEQQSVLPRAPSPESTDDEDDHYTPAAADIMKPSTIQHFVSTDNKPYNPNIPKRPFVIVPTNENDEQNIPPTFQICAETGETESQPSSGEFFDQDFPPVSIIADNPNCQPRPPRPERPLTPPEVEQYVPPRAQGQLPAKFSMINNDFLDLPASLNPERSKTAPEKERVTSRTVIDVVFDNIVHNFKMNTNNTLINVLFNNRRRTKSFSSPVSPKFKPIYHPDTKNEFASDLEEKKPPSRGDMNKPRECLGDNSSRINVDSQLEVQTPFESAEDESTVHAVQLPTHVEPDSEITIENIPQHSDDNIPYYSFEISPQSSFKENHATKKQKAYSETDYFRLGAMTAAMIHHGISGGDETNTSDDRNESTPTEQEQPKHTGEAKSTTEPSTSGTAPASGQNTGGSDSDDEDENTQKRPRPESADSFASSNKSETEKEDIHSKKLKSTFPETLRLLSKPPTSKYGSIDESLVSSSPEYLVPNQIGDQSQEIDHMNQSVLDLDEDSTQSRPEQHPSWKRKEAPSPERSEFPNKIQAREDGSCIRRVDSVEAEAAVDQPVVQEEPAYRPARITHRRRAIDSESDISDFERGQSFFSESGISGVEDSAEEDRTSDALSTTPELSIRLPHIEDRDPLEETSSSWSETIPAQSASPSKSDETLCSHSDEQREGPVASTFKPTPENIICSLVQDAEFLPEIITVRTISSSQLADIYEVVPHSPNDGRKESGSETKDSKKDKSGEEEVEDQVKSDISDSDREVEAIMSNQVGNESLKEPESFKQTRKITVLMPEGGTERPIVIMYPPKQKETSFVVYEKTPRKIEESTSKSNPPSSSKDKGSTTKPQARKSIIQRAEEGRGSRRDSLRSSKQGKPEPKTRGVLSSIQLKKEGPKTFKPLVSKAYRDLPSKCKEPMKEKPQRDDKKDPDTSSGKRVMNTRSAKSPKKNTWR